MEENNESTYLVRRKFARQNGNLVEAGYSVSEVRRYNREAICHGKLRIKEWDYYYIGNDEIGIALTIADNGYMSLVSASLMDFVTKEFTTTAKLSFFVRKTRTSCLIGFRRNEI